MRTILDAHHSHTIAGRLEVKEEGGSELHLRSWPAPAVHVVTGALVSALDPTPRQAVELSALLDTGADVTLISEKKREELEKSRKSLLQTRRSVKFWGKFRPAYTSLAFILPGGHECRSHIGFVEVADEESRAVLDVSEMLLGQDVLNQFIITFDGPNGTVTICEP